MTGTILDTASVLDGRGPRELRAPRGSTLSCKGWQQEAALRMLMNNLDPDVAERPDELVVYGGIGRAARDWESYDAIVASLRRLEGNPMRILDSKNPAQGWTELPHWPRSTVVGHAGLLAVLRHERDVLAALEFLKARPDVDPERIGGLGLSVGGEMMIEAAIK